VRFGGGFEAAVITAEVAVGAVEDGIIARAGVEGVRVFRLVSQVYDFAFGSLAFRRCGRGAFGG